MLRRRAKPDRREPTIALINIVFLMLVFFLVAGSISPPRDDRVTLVRTEQLEGSAPPDALVIGPDGTLSHRGAAVADVARYWDAAQTADGVARIVPDRDLPAQTLVQIGRALQAAGAARVVIVTQRGVE